MVELATVELAPPAAAVVLGQSQKRVNKAFDEGPLESHGSSRLLGGHELLYLFIYEELKDAGLVKWKNELRLKLYSSLKVAVSRDVDIPLGKAVILTVIFRTAQRLRYARQPISRARRTSRRAG